MILYTSEFYRIYIMLGGEYYRYKKVTKRLQGADIIYNIWCFNYSHKFFSLYFLYKSHRG